MDRNLESSAASVDCLSNVIGNTPLLAIHYRLRGKIHCIYAKAEYFNLTGSIKDRMALHIIRRAYRSGHIESGDKIIEATSGNTGISIAAIGCRLGHPVVIYMPDWMSEERVNLIRSYGASVILVSREDGGFLGSIRRCEIESSDPRVFLPRQFANEANVEAHALTTGPEILAQLEKQHLKPSAFVAGVGTGGTVMGILRCFREHGSAALVHPVEPSESPTLSTGHKVGSHRIQGISDEFIPDILKLSALDPVISISDGDSILAAQKLASKLGLGVGISSGCNLLAAIKMQQTLGDNAVVTTVFADDNKKYLTTGLMQQEPVRDDFLSPQIELLDYHVLPRLETSRDIKPKR